MAAMTTVLTEIPSNAGGSTVTYTAPGHTFSKVKLVIDKRRVPEGKRTVAEYSVATVYATEDADGLILDQKVAFTTQFRAPVQGLSTDIAAALALHLEIVASTNFANSVDTLEKIQ